MNAQPSVNTKEFVGLTITERISRVGAAYAREGWVLDSVELPPSTYYIFESIAGSQPTRYRASDRGLEILILGYWVWLSVKFDRHQVCRLRAILPNMSSAECLGRDDREAFSDIILYES